MGGRPKLFYSPPMGSLTDLCETIINMSPAGEVVTALPQANYYCSGHFGNVPIVRTHVVPPAYCPAAAN